MDLNGAKHNIRDLSGELIALGENPREINFWQEFYNHLDKEHQEGLLLNLLQELEELKRISGYRA